MTVEQVTVAGLIALLAGTAGWCLRGRARRPLESLKPREDEQTNFVRLGDVVPEAIGRFPTPPSPAALTSSAATVTAAAPATTEIRDLGMVQGPSGRLVPRLPYLPSITSSGLAGLTADRGRLGAFDVYAVSQLGIQHALKASPREDAYAMAGLPGQGGCIVAVADGLGSTRNAHVASLIAVRAGIEAVRRRMTPGIGPWSTEKWHSVASECINEVTRQLDAAQVDGAAEFYGLAPGHAPPVRKAETEPACTLSLAVLNTVGGNTEVVWASVGDSRIATIGPTSEFHWLSWTSFDRFKGVPESGSTVNNSVESLPREPKKLQTGLRSLPPGSMVVLASDGWTSAVELAPEYFVGALQQVASDLPAAHVLGELVDFDIRQLYDDRTLVAVWPSANVALT